MTCTWLSTKKALEKSVVALTQSTGPLELPVLTTSLILQMFVFIKDLAKRTQNGFVMLNKIIVNNMPMIFSQVCCIAIISCFSSLYHLNH